ncbi:Sex-lethal interacting like [Cryptosporidium canis]|uniref:Sex-lethal interacting like n=1 Tax=Cryptosporidium canis TaxID=195482 RepID=A0ABQ8P8I7_9CRYT|nr:Sex-lethal interacting like [Cryptosporidium canis]
MTNLQDQVEEEYEVILSHINDVSFHVFQFPMTSRDDSGENTWQSAFVRADGGSFQLSYYPAESSEGGPNSNEEMVDHSIPRQGMSERTESTNRGHLYTVNSKSCLSSSNCMVAGYFDHANKKLYITPISSVQQFRPNFSSIDQKRMTNMNVGMVERLSDSADKDERNQSLDDLVLNHGNNAVDHDMMNGGNSSSLYSGGGALDGGRFYTTGSENWIKIPCIYPLNSYESIEMTKALMDVYFDDFISWSSLNSQISEDNHMVNQLLSIKHSRNRTHYFDDDFTKYFKMVSGIASDGNSEFNLPFGGDGQVLPALRTAGLPKIYTAYQYPPSCPSSSLGGSMCYNFGGVDDSSSNTLVKSDPGKSKEYFPFHGISGKLLIYDDWLYYGPLSVQELYRMKLSDQIQRITLVYQVIPFSGIKNFLRRVYDSNSEDDVESESSFDVVKSQGNALEQMSFRSKLPSDKRLIEVLRKYCVLVSGNWVYRSELMYNEYESCCRDLILVLLQRDENAGLNREPIRVATDLPQIKVTNILQEVAVYRSTAWYPKFSFDRRFIEENIEEATFWKNYWSEREKYVVQYIRDNRDTSICTSTYLNNLSAVSTSVSNSQLQLLLIFILKIYGATNVSELLNLCSYHLTLMSVGNASLASVPNVAGGVTSSKPGDQSSPGLDSNTLSSGKTGPNSKFAHRGSSSTPGSVPSGPSFSQNFIAPTYSPFCSNNPKHNMKPTPFINVNSNISSSIKINKEDINKSLEIIATKIFDDLWILKSTGDPRIDAIRTIVIGYFSNGDREDVFTITSFIDNIKHCIVNSCVELSQKNKIWHNLDLDEDSTPINDKTNSGINASIHSSQLLSLLNNVPEFIWRKIIHEFAFPINETATVWKLKGK